MTSPLTPEERAELREIVSRARDRNPFIGMANSDMALYERCLDTPMFAYHFNRAAVELRESDEKLRPAILALLDESDAQAARIAELEARVRKWPTLECPCCGEEGAWATHFEDGQETTCGCGGIVSADGEGAHILIDEADCPKCKETP